MPAATSTWLWIVHGWMDVFNSLKGNLQFYIFYITDYSISCIPLNHVRHWYGCLKDLTGTGYRSIIQVRTSPKVESVHLTVHLFITENTMSRWTESPFWDVNASAYTDILDNFIFPTLWEQIGDGNLVFQHAQQCRKQGPHGHGSVSLVWRVLTSTR